MSIPLESLACVTSEEDQASWSGAAPSRDSEDPLVGTTLHDTYAVARILGEGGMGRVYEAHHTRVAAKRYAIKVLHAEFSLNPEIRRRFQWEAEAAATIEHAGVVGTYDVGKTPQGWPYMVCEYLAGVDLNEYLTVHGPLAPRAVVHIGLQLCSALRAAHARGVIHRDLKPHNVFVLKQDGDGSAAADAGLDAGQLPAVKVLDFGLSRFVERDNDLTKTGIILGTPGYMAPEQANGVATDVRTDIYGMGALLFAAATGRAPFKEETPQQTVLAVMSQAPPRPRDLDSAVPIALEIVIQKAMARDPKDRYQSAREMELALLRLHSDDARLHPGTSAEGAPLAPRLSLLVYAGASLLLGLLALLGAGFALLEIKAIDYARFRPSVLETLLLALLGLLLLVPLALLLRRFQLRTWNNSARIAELVPRIRRPLTAAILAYGFSAFVVRAGSAIEGVRAGSLSQAPLVSSLVWHIVLPTTAALAASSVMLMDAFRSTRNAFLQALTKVGYPAGAAVAGLLLLAGAFTWEPPRGDGARPPATDGQEGRPATPESQQSTATPDAEGKVSLSGFPPGDRDPGSEAEEARQADPQADPDESEALASSSALAVAVEEGPEALAELAKEFPQDVKVQKALVLAWASRADTLDRSAEAIARLLDVDDASQEDADVLFILKKALRSQGRAFQVAAAAIKNQLGPAGAEVVFQVMSEHPEQRTRLKGLFQELRQAEKASQEVLVAYDLRYASSCKARLEFLERAELHGDTRSLVQLKALSTAPKRCGWGRTCYPPCRAEAERFQRSAEVIRKRLAHATPSSP